MLLFIHEFSSGWHADGRWLGRPMAPCHLKAAVRTTMRQVAQAISYTHQQGIVHRDIKPENVLLQDNGNIALCDFGISKDIISNKYESTMVLSAAGTAAYCAPEAGNTSEPVLCLQKPNRVTNKHMCIKSM